MIEKSKTSSNENLIVSLSVFIDILRKIWKPTKKLAKTKEIKFYQFSKTFFFMKFALCFNAMRCWSLCKWCFPFIAYGFPKADRKLIIVVAFQFYDVVLRLFCRPRKFLIENWIQWKIIIKNQFIYQVFFFGLFRSIVHYYSCCSLPPISHRHILFCFLLLKIPSFIQYRPFIIYQEFILNIFVIPKKWVNMQSREYTLCDHNEQWFFYTLILALSVAMIISVQRFFIH